MTRIRSRIRMGHLDADVVIDCFRLMDKVRQTHVPPPLIA